MFYIRCMFFSRLKKLQLLDDEGIFVIRENDSTRKSYSRTCLLYILDLCPLQGLKKLKLLKEGHICN